MNKLEISFKNFLGQLEKRKPQILSDILLQDRLSQLFLVLYLLFFVTIWIFAVFQFKITDFLIPIRYNSFLGVTELGNWYEIYKLPLIFALVTIINIFLADLSYKKDRMISYLFLAANLFLSVVTLIILINFSSLIGKL